MSRRATPSSSARSTHGRTSSCCSTGRASRGCSRWSGWSPRPATNAIEIARDWAAQNELDVDDETLAEAFDLATHYLPAAASPGNVLRVLELVRDRIARGVATAIDAGNGDRDAQRRNRAAPPRARPEGAARASTRVRAYFGARVLGQPEAVECLVDRIALVKAGLTDPTRPLGVFLFVGPTGTGKTEIAKAFARLRVRLATTGSSGST